MFAENAHKVTETSVQQNSNFHNDISQHLKDEIRALNEKNNMQKQYMSTYKDQILKLEHKIEDFQHEIETKKDLNEQMKKKIENLTDTCNRLSTEVKNLNKTINNYEQLIGVKDTQLQQFRMSNTVRDNKFNAKIQLVKKKVELQYRQQGEKQRIDLARKIKVNIDKMKHEQTIWKEEFESQMSAQLQAAMSASLLQKEQKMKKLESQIAMLKKQKKKLMETESAYEEQVKVLRSKLLKTKFDSEHHHEKQKRSNQSIILEKDQAIEKLLSQLRDHNDLLQELHQNLQKEQDEKDELQQKVKLLQMQLNNSVETKHPGWV